MPRIIEYYLDEEPIIANVPTHICREKSNLAYTLDHLDELVVKPVGESGGYGIAVGPLPANVSSPNAARRSKRAPPTTSVSRWCTCRSARF